MAHSQLDRAAICSRLRLSDEDWRTLAIASTINHPTNTGYVFPALAYWVT